jgi:uncharacterized protein (TIGR02996 family)
MTHDQAFLQAICETPEDDTPRLIYADWLEEHGDGARAEFIRVQVELARPDLGAERHRLLEKRQDELLDLHGAAWVAALALLEGVVWDEFRGGFVERVKVEDVEVFLRRAPAIFTAAPVREVFFEPPPRPPIPLCDLQKLAASPYLARLTTLILCNGQIGDVGLEALVDSPHLGGLTKLFLSGNQITDFGLGHALALWIVLPRLTELDLRDNLITDEGIAALDIASPLSRLETLWLVNNQIGDHGVWRLAMDFRLSSLRHLYLNHNQIGDSGVMILAGSLLLPALRELDLRDNHITFAGARALLASPFLQGLTELLLTGNPIDRRTAAALRQRFGKRVRV